MVADLAEHAATNSVAGARAWPSGESDHRLAFPPEGYPWASLTTLTAPIAESLSLMRAGQFVDSTLQKTTRPTPADAVTLQ